MPGQAEAVEEALRLPEILEHILIKLSMRDLLLAQRVSQFWRDLIQDSRCLQQHLFLVPETPTVFWRSESNQSPISLQDSWTWKQRYTKCLPPKPNDNASTRFSARLNPILFKIVGNTPHAQLLRMFTNGDIFDMQLDDLAQTHPSSSWRRMYVTQPPIVELRYKLCSNSPMGMPRLSPNSLRIAITGDYVTADDVYPQLPKARKTIADSSSNLYSLDYLGRLLFPVGAILTTAEEEKSESFWRDGKDV